VIIACASAGAFPDRRKIAVQGVCDKIGDAGQTLTRSALIGVMVHRIDSVFVPLRATE
jgi:hypothetical protein